MLSGILLVDKPINWTSHDCVSKVRKIIGQKKVGHAGTLDPMATGLLVILLGKATKLFDACSGADKMYTGTITLGIKTDTFDFDGKIIALHPVQEIDNAYLDKTIRQFIGEQNQTVPRYSAARVNGKRSHVLARSNVSFKPIEKKITIHNFKRLNYRHPDMDFEASVEKGTYIRSLAFDLGEALGCGAALSSLRRLSSGSFKLTDAFTFSDLEKRPVSQIGALAEACLQKFCSNNNLVFSL